MMGPPSGSWNLDRLMGLAADLADNGPVLVGVDVVLGVSTGYWKLVQEASRGYPPKSFIHWLGSLDPDGEFFETAMSPDEWRVSRPWFKAKAGPGGLHSFTGKTADGMLRRVDEATGAKPVFAVSGIPGTVGSGTREFWKELVPHLSGDRNFGIWPFEGDFASLLAGREVVLCETYPALAYAAALADRLPTGRIGNSKTKAEWRDTMCDHLYQAPWIRAHQVEVDDLGPARKNEDDFDACFTVAAVLRCLCEGRKLATPGWVDDQAEGSMLLTGAVNPKYRVDASNRRGISSKLKARVSYSLEKRRTGREKRETVSTARSTYRCPIPGCGKVFAGSRGGWDGHAGSLRKHPDWNPEVTDPEQRRQLFRREFGDWFS